MPGKNKPKRLDRNRAWRVARRKKRVAKLVNGNSRNRKPRAKNKGKIVVEKVEKKTVKKVIKKKE
ncbi:hypothetical protein K8R30_03440 [archaeon]|nr:hypothetical protein [archaeon]